MEVVCLESKAFYQLIDEVVERLMEKHQEKPRWISVEDTMCMLNITSKTTLQKLKNEGKIRFSQPMRKLTLFDRQSILDFLEKHAQETF
ncbi:MAG: DNA-binding protein [Bacteroidota bacterium]